MWTRSKGPISAEMIHKTEVNGNVEGPGGIVNCTSRKKRFNGQTARRESIPSTGRYLKLEVGQEMDQLPHPSPPAKTILQLTEERLSNQVVHVQDDSITTCVPAGTIPEEVWLRVFGMLDSTDLSSCFRTCRNWKKWIMGKRAWLPAILFPEVAPLLLEKLPKSVLLECRKVCQVWKEGIDHAYQTHPQHIHLDWETTTKESKIRLPKLVTDFPNSEKIQRFLEAMEFHHGNPFVGRAISLNCKIHWFLGGDEVERFRSAYWNQVMQLLDVFGPRVHFATIELPCYDHIAVDMIVHLRNCLMRLPNLRRLKIAKWDESTRYKKEVQDFVSANPMPLLADLETLEIREAGVRDLTSEILNSCCVAAKIKRLDLGVDWGPCDAVFHFPSLEVVKSTFDMENFETVRELSRVPPLREVDFGFGYAEYPRVFKSLELFGDSLINAKINVDVDGSFSHGNGISSLQKLIGTDASISLPKLKRFVLIDYYGPLDPFLGLNSLEHLEFDWNGSMARGFIERNEPMFHSKVWTLMPSLKKVLVSLRGSCKAEYNRNSFFESTGDP